ncbi:hypothetical protein FA014_02045 [Cellulomonas hominis]|uniref:Uncharacterized protein n=1 Tax=Cellulomonas hominis TaxID=156981 RepID=A0A7Z8K1Y5_9CELL|nr:hypothetical protein [Cellulomonas hominis]TKR27162.1 hypothetical protein FA014_02045 [Cellulomonas hominis]
MSTTSTTASTNHPHVPAWKADLVAELGEQLQNTGGSDPLDLLEDLANPANDRFAVTNVVRFTLAVAVDSQVALLRALRNRGVLAEVPA